MLFGCCVFVWIWFGLWLGLAVSDLVVCGCSAGGCVLGGFGFRWRACVVWWWLGCLLFICSVVLVDCVLGCIRWVRLWLPRVLGVLLVAICVLGVVAGCAWWTVWICLLVLVLGIVFVGLVILCLFAMCLVFSSAVCLVGLPVGWC